MISWSIDFDVVRADQPDVVLARSSIPVEVPEGRPLHEGRAYMDQLIVDTCRAMHSDLVFNLLVRLSFADGTLDPRERALLHEVLRGSFGITDPALADARIAVETQRILEVDPTVLRKHLPQEALVSLYRFLYTMAQRDRREHNFLMDVLEKFGLDPDVARQIEREAWHGTAR